MEKGKESSCDLQRNQSVLSLLLLFYKVFGVIITGLVLDAM